MKSQTEAVLEVVEIYSYYVTNNKSYRDFILQKKYCIHINVNLCRGKYIKHYI